MKNRRNVVIAFLLIAVLCMSIGFALVSDDLQANATMNVKGSNFEQELDDDVYFELPQTGAVSGTAALTGVTAVVGADANGDEKDQLTITVPDTAFTDQNQTVIVTVDIKNDNATQSVNINFDDVVFGGNTPTNNPFTVTVAPSNAAATNIDAMGSQTYTITITLAKIPAEDITGATFTIDFTATPGE